MKMKLNLEIIESLELDANEQSLWYFRDKDDIGILEYHSYYREKDKFRECVDRSIAISVNCYRKGVKKTFNLPFDNSSVNNWRVVFREHKGGILAFQLIADTSLKQVSYRTLVLYIIMRETT